jgi:predicted ATPase
LNQLVDAELIFHAGAPGSTTYVFKHALVQEIAYDTMLRKQRQELHAHIASVLESSFPDTKVQQPELLAHHYTEGNLVESAIDWWLRAARKAAAQSAMIEATAHLQRGLGLLAKVPENLQRLRKELEFQSELGAALVATKGAAAVATGEAYGRARRLCELTDDVGAWVLVLGGQSSHHLQRREYAAMRQIGDDLLRFGERSNDVTSCLVGHRVNGICAHQRGQFAEAKQNFEKILALYVADLHRSIVSVAAYDVRAVALAYLSWDLYILGYSGQALERSHESLAWCEEIRHPHSLGFALGIGRCIQSLSW